MRGNSQWRDRIEMLMPPLPWDRPHWHDTGGPPVVLLHGLWRGWHAMEPLARNLRKNGFSTLNIPYPSSRLPIATLANRVCREVAKIASNQPVHFITHSLGGIILRSILARPTPWQTGRIVMLAAPNRGSEIVDWANHHPPLQWLLGPAGKALGCDGIPNKIPALPATTEAAVIMGDHSNIPLFKKLLSTKNDGIVSVENGRLAGLRGFTVIPADHTFIQMHPETLRLTRHFLKTGEWLG